MSGASPNVLLGCATALLLAILGGLFTLVWHGSVSGTDAMVTITAIVGIAGGAFAVHSGVNAGAQAANTIPFSAQDQPKP